MTEYTMAALLLTGAMCFILGAVYGALVNEIGRMVRSRQLESGGQNEPDVSVDRYRGTERGHHPDTGGHCPESRPRMSGIDRNALLALADEMDMDAGCHAYVDDYGVYEYARRIREALGVER